MILRFFALEGKMESELLGFLEESNAIEGVYGDRVKIRYNKTSEMLEPSWRG